MRVSVSEQMKDWVAGYIRSHRREGAISIHVVYSNFNYDFKETFSIDPGAAVQLMIAEGFLKGNHAKGGFSIWLPEDEGKGRSRPFRPHKKEVNGAATPATKNQPSADQNGESEMTKTKTETKEDTIIEPVYAFEKVPHPKTGKIDVLDLIRYIMEGIAGNIPNKPDMDGGYAKIKQSAKQLFADIGLPEAVRPDLWQIMQSMALVRPHGRGQWGILHSRAAEYFITPCAYKIALQKYKEHQQRNREIASLRQQLQQLRAGVATSEAKTSSTLFDDEALEILVEAELLAEELAKAQQRITELEAERDKLQIELATRPTSVDAAKEALRERLAALKRVNAS
jgi:hypothetical protein